MEINIEVTLGGVYDLLSFRYAKEITALTPSPHDTQNAIRLLDEGYAKLRDELLRQLPASSKKENEVGYKGGTVHSLYQQNFERDD